MRVDEHYRAVLARMCRAAAAPAVDGAARAYLREISYVQLCTSARQWVEQLEGQFVEVSRMRDAVELINDPAVFGGDAVHGFEVIQQIRADILGLQPRPTDFQMQLIWFVVELMAPMIFGDAWKTDRLRIKRQMGWTSDYAGIGAVLTGRKEGKSTGLGMAAAIALLNVPHISVALFSKTQAQSSIILQMAKRTLASHPRISGFKVASSARAITISTSATDERTMRAWSGSANVRGVYGRLGVGGASGAKLDRCVGSASVARRASVSFRLVRAQSARAQARPTAAHRRSTYCTGRQQSGCAAAG